MNTHDFKGYTKHAREILLDLDFRIEDNFGEKRYGFAHLICECERCCPFGLGGQAFRHWVAGVFRDGVYVYADNYKVGVSFASVPEATVSSGCQASCARGDPWPRLSEGKWMHVSATGIPDDVRGKVLRIANKLVRDAVVYVAKRGDVLAAEVEAKRLERVAEHGDMVSAWTGPTV